MSLIASVISLLKRKGRDHTLRRRSVAAGPNNWTQGFTSDAFNVGKAHTRRGAEKTLDGELTEGEFLVIISPDFPVAPVSGDHIAVGVHAAIATGTWVELTHVKPIDDGAQVGVYRCIGTG
jgi:hypothetical protein